MARAEGYTGSMPSRIPTSLQCYVEDVMMLLETEEKGKLMKYEWGRYISFRAFPRTSPVHSIKLSKSGFYYTGQGDETICFSCGLRNKNWKEGDSPSEIHTRLSPNCKFANDNEDGNIPISNKNTYLNGSCIDRYQISDPNIVQIPPSESTNWLAEGKNTINKKLDKIQNIVDRDSGFFTTTTTTTTTATTTTEPENIELHMSTLELAKNKVINKDGNNLGIHLENAMHPHYATVTSRLESFRGWPSLLTQKPSELAAAGLYYVGVEDCVRCFFCGGGLRSWEEGDDPWEEHARWYPDCSFLKTCKGDLALRQLVGVNLRSEETLKSDRHNNGTMEMRSVETLTSERHDDGALEMRSRDEIRSMSDKSIVEEVARTNATNSPAVQSVLFMGYSLEMVKQALEILESREGHATFSANDLLEVIFQTEESKPTTQQKNELYPANDIGETLEEINGKEDNMNAVSEQKNNTLPPQENAHSKLEENNNYSSNDKLSFKEMESLLEQNQDLRDQMTCKICMERDACIVFLPCGHMMTCPQCAPALRKCPVCRQLIKGTIRAYTS